MSSTREILYTFLASPSDLQEERKAIRDVVTEFNECWAEHFGYHIELLGWEDTVAGFGRPQHLINQDVDRCDLFIGLIWKRWGTPPDRDGTFSSGFQEEFERSITRREKSGSPEIALFFKEIPGQFMEDPGDDLKKVLEFQKKIEAEKKILYKKFSNMRDIEKLVRKRIAAHLDQVKEADATSDSKEVRTKPADSEPEREHDKKAHDSSPLSAEGFSFLKNFVDIIGREDAMADLTASDIARFRLLANSISQSGNQEMYLGAHDINILFSVRAEGMKLGKRENLCLTRLGFQYLSNENIPLWCWYSDLPNSPFDPAILLSFSSASDDERVGALSMLSTLAREISINHKYITRENILNTWFSEKSSVRVKCAALEYLTKMGTAEDYAIAKKERESGSGTFQEALECMIGILLRTGQELSAQQLALDSPFRTLDDDMLQSVLDGFDRLENEKLLPGLEHLNARVRLRILKILLERGSLTKDMAERLSRDEDASIRNEAVMALIKLGISFTEEEVKNILISEEDSDSEGEKFFTRYKRAQLKELTERELTEKIETGLILGDNETAYFVRVEKYFAKYAKELRHDIDDTFKTYFEERIRRVETLIGASSAYSITQQANELKEEYRDLENFYRKRLTRQGLDILCEAGKREDLQRIRINLQNGYAGASKADAKYLGRYGEWTDIPLLSNVEIGMLKIPQSTSLTNYYEGFQGEAAKAALSISRGHPLSELFALEMPVVILKKTIESCVKSRFSKISDETLFKLLYHESPDVRKAASIKAVQAFSVKRIKSILREYICGDTYYYNVIHWLDLGASMSRTEALKVALAATGSK